MSGTSPAWRALQAVIEAAHDPLGHAGQHDAEPVPSPADVAPLMGFAQQRYAALLARLLVAETPGKPPRILVVAACPRTRSTPVALGVTQAAAGLVGRTLLVDGWAGVQDGDHDAIAAAGNGTDARPLVLPDVYVPRLHHYRLGAGSAESAFLFGQDREDALASLTASFQFVVIDAPPPASAPIANALARSCSGCVIVARAGVTGQADIQGTILNLQCAGASIAGVVLADAPGTLPQWAGGTAATRSRQDGRVLA